MKEDRKEKCSNKGKKLNKDGQKEKEKWKASQLDPQVLHKSLQFIKIIQKDMHISSNKYKITLQYS